MNNRGKPPRRVIEVLGRFFSANRNALLAGIVGLVLLLTGPVRAADADARYLEIYGLIEQADALNAKGPAPEAKVKYQAAEKALKELKQTYPTWNVKLVASRLNYLADKMASFSKAGPAHTTAGATNEIQPAKPTLKAVVPGQPQIKLLEAGAEPRQVLRLTARVGATQKVKLTIRMKMGVVAPDLPGEMMTMPPMILAATITAKEVSAEGDTAFEVVIDEASVQKEAGVLAEVAEEMRKQFGAMKGLVLAGTMSDRYFGKRIEAKIPPGTDAETRESMEQMKEAFANTEFILPEEAIGVGAKWEVKQKTKDQGMTIDETIRHEVVSIEGDTVVVKSSTTQSAANQKIPNPIVPTLKVDLTKMTGTATETASLKLHKMFPVKATAEERTEVNMTVNNGGKKQTMTIKTESRSTLESE